MDDPCAIEDGPNGRFYGGRGRNEAKSSMACERADNRMCGARQALARVSAADNVLVRANRCDLPAFRYEPGSEGSLGAARNSARPDTARCGLAAATVIEALRAGVHIVDKVT